MTYNTGNPIGSADSRDLYDNAENLDEAVNSTEDTWTDRLGKVRPTLRAAIDPTGLASSSARSASEASAARDAAQLSAGVYSDTATGLSATVNGDYFSVPVGGDVFLALYRNNSGQADFIEEYPSVGGVANQIKASLSPSKFALPNSDYHLLAPAFVKVDGRGNILETSSPSGVTTSVTRGARNPISYPFRAYKDDFVLAKSDAVGNIIDGHKELPELPDQLGRMFVDLDVDAGDLWMTWRHGADKMLRVRYMRNGFNKLFNWRSTEIADLGDPRTTAWTLISSTTSDSWPPLIFSVDANGDGGSSIYTGGNHGSDGGSGGENTAYMSAIEFTVDGRALRPGESFVGFAERVQVYWRNEIMAYNTITLGRYPLSQEIQAEFNAGDVSAFVAVTAHEPITMGLDNGPQMFSQGYDSFHYYGGEQQATLPIPSDGSTNTSGLFRDFPAWATVFSHPEYGFHGAWLDRTFEAGDGRYISGSAGAFRKGTGLKFYSIIVGTGNLPMAAGDTYEWHGGYFWAPADVCSGDTDSAFTFHRRRVPHLGYAHVAAGSGRITPPEWAAGNEVLGVGIAGINGIAVSAIGYNTAFNEIKR